MPTTISAMSDTTLSPAPFSPFSTYSTTSGATSDDAPDLGAFPTVFRELNTFHYPRANSNGLHSDDSGQSARTPTSTFLLSDYDSEPQNGSTVWNQGPIADYLESESSSLEDREETTDQPSLGLAGVFDFLAQERARLATLRLRDTSATARTAGHSSSTTSDGTWRHAVQPRRRRRRRRDKRSQSLQVRRTADGDGEDATTEATGEDDEEDDISSDAAPANYYESQPPSPPPTARQRDRRRAEGDERDGRPVVHHSRSTPSLRLRPIVPIDPRVLQLRNLAHKLRMLYPRDAGYLSAILSNDQPDDANFVDPRGPGPLPKDTLIHVFIDHSNILIGFLVYLRRHIHRTYRKSKTMSHAALALILERGRPVTRRVLATSSPLVQPVDSAEQLGYEVHVLQRVPDAGDGADRQYGGSSTNSSGGEVRPQSYRKGKGHTRNSSSLGGAGRVSADSNSDSAGANGSTPSRRRFREQGVDELLQLKIHQALASADVAPPNGTIILATGDGNVGQFNEEGFLGCVRLAIRKGWRVELYAWEGGLSKTWKKEFGNNKLFEIYMLDRFAMDLLEL